MGDESIAKDIVGYIHRGEIDEGGIWTAMIGMTGPAGQVRILYSLITMEGRWVYQVCSDIRMARHTAIRHGGILPKISMASRARFAQGGMGGNTTQDHTHLGVELTRTEEDPTTQLPNSKHQQGSQQGGDQPGNGEATKRFLCHRFTISGVR